MRSFFRGLGSFLFERVIVANKSTFLGLGLAALTEGANYLQAQPQPWAHWVAGGVATALALYRSKPADPVVGLSLKAFACVALVGVTGCGIGAAAGSLTLTKDGTKVTTSVSDAGLICTDWAPPFTYFDETCSGICTDIHAPSIDKAVILKCVAASGLAHSVALKRYSP